jgi:hypothetical protein
VEDEPPTEAVVLTDHEKVVLTRVQAKWRSLVGRRRNSLNFLKRFEGCQVRGVIIFLSGSAGLTAGGLRFARMLGGMGFIFISPDHMAGGRYRQREVADLFTDESDTDYWSKDLVYTSSASGENDGVQMLYTHYALTMHSLSVRSLTRPLFMEKYTARMHTRYC